MEWIRFGSLDADVIPYKCSECGHDIVVDWIRERLPEKCPKCGKHAIKFNTWETRVASDFDDIAFCNEVEIPPYFEAAIDAVKAERMQQVQKWGADSDNHPFEWMSILGEEFGELCEAVNETYFKRGVHPERGGYDKIIKEATQVATVAISIIEQIIRQQERIKDND